MVLGRQTFSSIQNALRKRLVSVKATKTWLNLHSELSIGARSGDEIMLSQADRDSLRDFIISKIGIDPLHENIDGDRIEMALRTSNEKLSDHSVFGNEIKVFRNERHIKLMDGVATTPPGSYLTTSPDNIDLNDVDAIVVVENGAPFRDWSKAVMAPPLHESLAVYRGHDENARSVMELLNKRRASIKVYAAVDFDPAGFRIALSLGADAILIPKNHKALLSERHLNKPEVFEKQNNRKSDAMIPAGWKEEWEWLHDNRIAITQEALLSRNWPLIILQK